MTTKDRAHVELICGPMFSGKSTMLIERLLDAEARGRRVLACKPAHDRRYSETRIVTHDGRSLRAINIESLDSITSGLDADVIGFDEVHFYEDGLVPKCIELLDNGTQLVLAGVDLDHRGDLFEVMAQLQQIAHRITRLTATCAQCGADAQHSQRLVESDARIVVGGAEAYEPRCSKCFGSALTDR